MWSLCVVVTLGVHLEHRRSCLLANVHSLDVLILGKVQSSHSCRKHMNLKSDVGGKKIDRIQQPMVWICMIYLYLN